MAKDPAGTSPSHSLNAFLETGLPFDDMLLLKRSEKYWKKRAKEKFHARPSYTGTENS